MVGTAFKSIKHLFYEVLHKDQGKLRGRVIDCNGQVPGNIVAEGGYSRVVVGLLHPLADKVGKAVDEDLCSGLFSVAEKEILPLLFERPYSLFPKRPERKACQEEDSMTGQVFPCFFRVFNKVEAKPKFPS